jgi:crossover junction endodeoxyribonuclease RuvC
MDQQRIIGIDPGIARMGFGIVDVAGNRVRAVDYGCIETPPEWSVAERLQKIYRDLRQIMADYQPRVMAVEELFFYRNTTTAFVVGQARGVALLAGVDHGLAVVEYTPMQVKMAVTGYGKADKKQVQDMVRILLGLTEVPKPDDTADALAIAITHAHAAPVLNALDRVSAADTVTPPLQARISSASRRGLR